MRGLHPSNPLGRLYVTLRGQEVGLVERAGLHIDHSGKDLLIDVEEPRPAVAAKEPATMLR